MPDSVMKFCSSLKFLPQRSLLAFLVLAGFCFFQNSLSKLPAKESLTKNPEREAFFVKQVAPILTKHCLECHNDDFSKGNFSLSSKNSLKQGGESGDAIDPGDPEASYLMSLITTEQTTGEDAAAEMPKEKPPLSSEEQAVIRKWISEGAFWPDDLLLKPKPISDTSWWSLQPLNSPEIPSGILPNSLTKKNRNPIDAFIGKKLEQEGLGFSPQASKATLIRRLYFDLLGLPPTPEEVESFLNDSSPLAYENLVDRLLKSPRYGERWARHWLDVVHFGETHGYDKDKLRLNAWPYRDYVINSFNTDKPWSRFVKEQIAGDTLYPETTEGIVAMGFISAGPWDFVGHAEVPESKRDGKIARHLDRDDMVRNTIESFCSLTVGCAQCHHHKFDPISQEDYYALQAVFSALDRADRDYFEESETLKEYVKLKTKIKQNQERIDSLLKNLYESAGTELSELDQKIKAFQKEKALSLPKAYGYHSGISPDQNETKWVQVNFKQKKEITSIILRPCFDDFNGIGDGFGFPLRFRVELSNDPLFKKNVVRFNDVRNLLKEKDFLNPGLSPVEFNGEKTSSEQFQFVRITATKLAPRKNDYIFALAEVEIRNAEGINIASDKKVTAKDSIEAPPRWAKSNLVDQLAPTRLNETLLAKLKEKRQKLFEQAGTPELHQELQKNRQKKQQLEKQFKQFPKPKKVYAGTIHSGSGNFVGRGKFDGKPRPVFLLKRGDITKPDYEVTPGTLSMFKKLPNRFEQTATLPEQYRRAALANWLTDKQNVLTWRSIVNRVWQYHFGVGIVETPNDFGRMGAVPTHPKLLDWLATDFRENGQSLKRLHRLIVTSRVYQQESNPKIDSRVKKALQQDVSNRLLWRMNPKKLDAESIRDSIIFISGQLNLKMGGPSFQDFVIEKPEHSPHYQYHLHDPKDPKSHRRSIYRFLVRSQRQPFMSTLDCADPSLSVPRRNESLTPLQALTLLNNGLVVTMSQKFAQKLKKNELELEQQVKRGFYEVTGRHPEEEELKALQAYAEKNGIENYCRMLFNLNEFSFID